MSQVHYSQHHTPVPVPAPKPNTPKSSPSKQPHHKRRPPSTTTTTTTTTSISHLRRKIRDLTRLLSRSNAKGSSSPTLPPAATIQTERALASYKRDLALLQQSTKEKRLNDRYRMVRFFERQKSTRQLKKLTRQSPPPSPTKLLTARLNLNYTLYYPPNRKYISLYRDSSSDPNTQRAKEEILNDIRQRMEDGTLGKWTVDVGRDNAFVLDDDYEEEGGLDEEEEGGVQLAGHYSEEPEEESKQSKKRKTGKKDKEDKKHKGTGDKSSKDTTKSRSKQKHGKNAEEKGTQPSATESSGFFEF